MYSYPFTCTHVCMYTYIGMKVLYRTFPKGMLTGVVPKSCLPSPPPTARKGSGKQSVTPKPSISQHDLVIHRSRFTSEGENCNHVAMVILPRVLTCTYCNCKTSISPNPNSMLRMYIQYMYAHTYSSAGVVRSYCTCTYVHSWCVVRSYCTCMYIAGVVRSYCTYMYIRT